MHHSLFEKAKWETHRFLPLLFMQTCPAEGLSCSDMVYRFRVSMGCRFKKDLGSSSASTDPAPSLWPRQPRPPSAGPTPATLVDWHFWASFPGQGTFPRGRRKCASLSPWLPGSRGRGVGSGHVQEQGAEAPAPEPLAWGSLPLCRKAGLIGLRGLRLLK